jgi:2-keto-4-pentenoate hydratase
MTGPASDPRITAGLDRQFATWRSVMKSGASRLGWKVGFGAPAALELMEISQPLLGFLTDATELQDGAEIDVRNWAKPVIEFEVALILARDVAGDASPAEAAAAVGAVAPAIELADIDIAPLGPGAVTSILAGNIFHRAVMLGAADTGRSGIRTSDMTATISVDGETTAAISELEALTGNHAEIVASVAATLAQQGEMLQAGDVLITGSVIPPLPVERAKTYTFRLDPLPPIRLHATP